MILRQASGPDEILACQRLRYLVFYEELGASPVGDMAISRFDSDRFDAICDHLVVVRRGEVTDDDGISLVDGELIGTYRLLRQEVAEANGGFYTQGEFDIAPLIAAHPQLRFLELGRSCVLAPYRTKPVVELLWQGIWNYVRLHRIDVMLGCASLEGTNPDDHAVSLGLLANAAAPSNWNVQAHPDQRIEMNRLPSGQIDQRQALKLLPPLIKGYLRLGCYIGDGAVIDRQFNTIDVLIILPVSAINPRYFAHFGAPTD
ncbi:GNAT family N-acetyltransferase [Aestuariivirga litoralis]|uniref:GNAT family N-acetyltransferase n=1 Tax=Aestuariivirga litoralis TaxID=2650924 RepID=UPI001FE13688|nr:GNAT family N-acyltransferase [Aestuariivirga litoralis]